MKDKKKIVVIIISVVLFIILILGVTYAFFNYNRSVADRFSTSSVDLDNETNLYVVRYNDYSKFILLFFI